MKEHSGPYRTYARAQARYKNRLTLARHQGSRVQEGYALHRLAEIAWLSSEIVQAHQLCEQALALIEGHVDPLVELGMRTLLTDIELDWSLAREALPRIGKDVAAAIGHKAADVLGYVLAQQARAMHALNAEPEEVEEVFSRAVEAAHEGKSLLHWTYVLRAFGHYWLSRAQWEQARVLLEESGRAAKLCSQKRWGMEALCWLAVVASELGEITTADLRLSEARSLALAGRTRPERVTYLECWGMVEWKRQRPLRATYLLEAANGLRQALGGPYPLHVACLCSVVEDDLRAQLGNDAYEQVLLVGWRCYDDPLEEIEAVLNAASFQETLLACASPAMSHLPDLPAQAVELRVTRRELSILRMVAEGRTTRQIAEAHWLSRSTISLNLCTICCKLGVTSRTQASLYALEHHWLD